MNKKRIVGVELNHHNAPIEVREKVAFNSEQTSVFLRELAEEVEEVFIISTCNRLAVYAYTESFKPIKDFFSRFGNLNRHLCIYSDTELATENLFATAAGLESQAIGEHQIMGQIRQAFELAREAGTMGPYLDEFIRKALHVGKRVRHETNIGKFSTSLATVGFNVIEEKYKDLSKTSVLVIGTGNMANLVATILERTEVKHVYIASHDMQRAETIAKEWGGEPVDMKNLYDILPKVEIVIGGTQAEVNLLSEQALENSKCPRAQFALAAGEPKLFIDFGMPRNFNPRLKEFDNVTLYDLDDIKQITYDGLVKRESEIPRAKEIVKSEQDQFVEWTSVRSISPLIGAFWQNLEGIKKKELDWLMPKLEGISDTQAKLIEKFAHRLIRQVSKHPFKQMKEVANKKHEDQNPIEMVKNLFNIDGGEIFIPKKKIIIGSRASKLALTQTNMVIADLQALEPQYEFVLKTITTKGDKGEINEVGAFTKGIQKALLSGEIDVAIHSLKDLPSEGIEGLTIGAIPKRVDNRDVLISNDRHTLETLPKGAKVGTGSLRREIQLKKMRPDLEVEFIRGNIDGRMKQMEDGKYDAIILAAAGLKRMDLISKASYIFPLDEMIPAVNQGALGIEVRDAQDHVYDLVSRLNDRDSYIEALAEREFLRTLGGGCNEPYAAVAKVEGDKVQMKGMYASVDGSNYTAGEMAGDIGSAKDLGRQLATSLIRVKELNEVEA